MTNNFIPARPTIYNGIKMRSRLEARFAGILDAIGVTAWEYEGVAYASGGDQYLPDFTVRSSWTAIPWIIEVKPCIQMERADGETFDDVSTWLTKMQCVYETEPGAGLAIACPALGDFLYVEYESHFSNERVRGLAAFCREFSSTEPLLVPLFGTALPAYYIADKIGLDWGWS